MVAAGVLVRLGVVLRAIFTASHWFKKDSLGGAVRWCVAESRWRPAVAMFTTAHGSESLRTVRVGGWRACGGLKVKSMVKSRRLRRASATGDGAGSRCWAAADACGRVCPGSLVADVA